MANRQPSAPELPESTLRHTQTVRVRMRRPDFDQTQLEFGQVRQSPDPEAATVEESTPDAPPVTAAVVRRRYLPEMGQDVATPEEGKGLNLLETQRLRPTR